MVVTVLGKCQIGGWHELRELRSYYVIRTRVLPVSPVDLLKALKRGGAEFAEGDCMAFLRAPCASAFHPFSFPREERWVPRMALSSVSDDLQFLPQRSKIQASCYQSWRFGDGIEFPFLINRCIDDVTRPRKYRLICSSGRPQRGEAKGKQGQALRCPAMSFASNSAGLE
jgi:hypothetical protein